MSNLIWKASAVGGVAAFLGALGVVGSSTTGCTITESDGGTIIPNNTPDTSTTADTGTTPTGCSSLAATCAVSGTVFFGTTACGTCDSCMATSCCSAISACYTAPADGGLNECEDLIECTTACDAAPDPDACNAACESTKSAAVVAARDAVLSCLTEDTKCGKQCGEAAGDAGTD
jgi:hypothetical protein